MRYRIHFLILLLGFLGQSFAISIAFKVNFIFRANEDQVMDIMMDTLYGDEVEKRALVNASEFIANAMF